MIRRSFLKLAVTVLSAFGINAKATSNETSKPIAEVSTMTSQEIKPFGNIDKENVEEYYQAEIVINGVKTEIDLNFESTSIDEPAIQLVSNFISKLDSMALKAFDAISDDYDLGDESETARFYLQHHMEALPKEALTIIFGGTEVSKQYFLKALSLYRVGIYPEDDESFAIFDIQFSREITDYLMAVTFDANGQLSFISMDS